MVGVPRSRGCINCKRKKKGCDLAQPTCGQCAKLRIECTYKQRVWTFINEQVSTDEFQPAVKVTERTAIILQHRSFSRTALEIQVVDQFWKIYLPRDDPNTVYIGAIVKAPWKRAVQAICLQDRWVLIALQACAFMSLGRLQRNRHYVQYGRQLYGRALRETNNAIRDPARAQSDGTLASCKLLGMYESFRLEEDGRPSTQGNDWRQHVEGTCRIVELRGPEMAASDYGHDLYTDARFAATSSGITQKRPANFFSSSAWTTVPWTKHSKTLRDELLDLMAGLPGILHQQEALYAEVSNATDGATMTKVIKDGVDVLKQCISLGARLQTWEEKTMDLAREARGENENDTLTLFHISKDHGFAFFHLITQFWTVCLILHGPTWLTYWKLLHVAQSTTFPATKDLSQIDIPFWMNPQPFASNISHQASHFFSEEAGLWGSSTASFPMGAALHYYAATGGFKTPEMRMLKAALGSSPKANMVSGFLRSMASSAAPQGGDPKIPVQHEKMATSWFDSTSR
ncbi:hypothetical protein M409DRAFT_50068 [Zasmidium cellare ATCC 36951]|uniref:Zn(2)-C6 fungal-type domain-containing protein n=1 Tax=Zasmidium cellare ATCC 36951 TaxID=1080233 RepID=A0A6A6CYU6_ZASCE|nr:uncharacterized protein M409DRAFT_50068 [Zasmidium cellare ATCC 36951]KAF2172354.1 hypothetical protein M409DRAFT_50068 [Zasmidium cellare ATCC 36951]